MSESLIPIPELHDEIPLSSGEMLQISRDNAEVVRHKNYDQMNHLYVKDYGKYGLYLFGIDATPRGEYLDERGYTQVTREYPDTMTQKVWVRFAAAQMDMELESGKGHELE